MLEAARREYYGISWTSQSSLTLSHSGVSNAQILDFKDYAESEKGGISIGLESISDVLSCPHQILCIGDRIVATNTGRNCLTVFRTDDFFFRHFWFDPLKWDKSSDGRIGSHFNSVFHKDGSLYLLALNPNLPSYILKLSWPSLDIVERIDTTASGAHNIWVTDEDEVIICNSLNASIEEVRSGSVLWQSDELNVMTRGLACAGDLVFAGCSTKGDRTERTETHGGLWVLDKRTWRLLDFISMPFSGNIHEIRILDAPDECHHGQLFQGNVPFDPQAAEHFQEHTARLEASKPPPGWKMQIGKCDWENAKEFSVNESFAIATQTTKPMKNVRVTASVSLDQASVGSHLSLIARYLGPSDCNMYLGMLYKNENSYSAQIWKNIAGQWSRESMELLSDVPESLTFEILENRLSLIADQNLVLQVSDDSLLEPGQVGVRGTGGTIRDFQASSI